MTGSQAQTFGFRIPLKDPVRGAGAVEGILVRGPAGWGEYSPVPGYSDGKHAACWSSAMSSASRPWPRPVRSEVPVAVLIPAVSPPRAVEIVRASGCAHAKVKVGGRADEARVEAVREAMGPAGRIRIDANGAWTVEEAVKKIRVLQRYDLEFVEQPVASLHDMVKVRLASPVPLAADELVDGPEQARTIALRGAADILVLKVQHLGGVHRSVQVAEAGGLPVVVSALLETSIGISAGLALAAALPELPYACGLGSSGLLESDVTGDPLAPVGGFIRVRRVQPEFSLLDRYSASVAAPALSEGAGA